VAVERSERRLAVLCLALGGLLGAVRSSSAHDLEFTHTVVVIGNDGSFRADVSCDLDAIALGVAQGADSRMVVDELRKLTPRELEARVKRVKDVLLASVLFRFDDDVVLPEVELPQFGKARDSPIPTIFGLDASFVGRIPPSARSVTIEVDRAFPPVYLTVMDQRGGDVVHEALTRGEQSDPFPIVPSAGSESDPDRESGPSSRPALVPPGRLAVAVRYFRLGLRHIVPEGNDHILFVLGLFLLSPRPRDLLFQVTAFTVAHTLTLALSSYGVVRLPPGIVEPLIALSIAYVAIENLLTRELTRWRPLVVFLFGLLHGMGFAGVLGELGLPREEFFLALVSFNGGVEAGQLTVLLAAFFTIGWMRHRAWYRSALTIPLSLAIAVVGLYWAVERSILG
jgi:HupE / UreJ protein